MSLPPGTHHLGPDNATLAVRTERAGTAAKAGHDLLLHVTSWEATIAVADDPAETSAELRANGESLRVIKGTGGVMELGDDDIASLHQTIDEEVLRRQDIEFRSTRVREADGDRLAVEGDLTIVGRTNPISFELEVGEGAALSATAVVTQSEWGIEPYSVLFGALKVHDEVEVSLEGTPVQRQSR